MNREDTVLITGASRGIGRAVAEKIADSGANIIINYNESEQQANTVADNVRSKGAAAKTVQADVAKKESVEILASEASEFGGGIDYLVNNAGAILRPGSWQDIDTSTWDRTVNINLKGVFNCIQEIAPRMVEQGHGKIVNVTSTTAITGAAPVIAYSAAKGGVITLTRSYAKALAPEVSVNSVALGNFDTEMTRSAGDEFIEQVISETPMQRLGEPHEAAGIIQFLLSDISDFITGETLIMDGGHRL